MLGALAACDNSFEPITEDRTDFFAVFGFLDTGADTQFVRVSPLRNTLELSSADLRAQAVSTHLATGAQVVWHDSLVVLDDGQPGLLFFAQFPVAPGDIYRLEVQGADDEVTRAVTQIPVPFALSAEPLQQDFNRRLTQRLTLLNQARLPQALSVRYELTPPGAAAPVTMTLPFVSVGPSTPGGVQVVVHLEADREEILRRLELPRIDSTVVLHSVGLAVEHHSDEWQTPETAVNIEQGFGFFGAIARYVVVWELAAEDMVRLGFTPSEANAK